MRILHLTPELPYEEGGGGRGHEFFMCRRLAELGHDVLNVSPVLPSEAHWSRALLDVGVENWVLERPVSHVREAVEAVVREPSVLATAMVAPVRALEMRVFWVRLRDLVAQAVSYLRPDVAIVGHDMAAGWVEGLPASVPVVLTLHNLTWRWYLSRARRGRGLAPLVLRAEARRHQRYLLGLLPRYKAAVALSEIEARDLRARAEIPVSVLPVGVDTRTLHSSPEQDGPPRVLFTGTLGYPPNSEGIRWLVDHVWPQVRAAVPDVRLDVVGRDPPAKVRALEQRRGVSIVGAVPSMAPYFARAHVVVVPILTGAGVRVKIVEAMAAGRAIVSTSLGWEGLPYVRPGRHLIVADESEPFAAAVIELLRDRETRRRLGIEARRLAEQRYDWRALGDDLERVLVDVVDRRGSPRAGPVLGQALTSNADETSGAGERHGPAGS